MLVGLVDGALGYDYPLSIHGTSATKSLFNVLHPGSKLSKAMTPAATRLNGVGGRRRRSVLYRREVDTDI